MDQESKKLRQIYYGLWVAFAVLIVFGMVNVFSSTFVDDRLSGNTYNHLIRQFIFVLIGLGVSRFIFKKDYGLFRRYTRPVYIGTLILLLLVLVAGVTVNGAQRWIGAGFIIFQPSELAKLAAILYTSGILSTMLQRGLAIRLMQPVSRRIKRKFPWWPFRHILNQALWIPLILSAFVFKQPDMGTALVIFTIPCVMLFVSGAPVRKAALPLAVLFAAGLVFACFAEYRRNRLISWFDPWSYAQTLGYQTVQGLIAIGSGGLTGQGLGTGVSKFSYLPEAHTDFAFAVFSQEWGMLGSVVMLSLFGLVVFCGMSCAARARDPYGMLLAMGVTLYLGGQGFINIGMVSGLLPVVGVPLPFISYGGTSLIVNMAAAAILLNIAKRNWKEAVHRQIKRKEAAQDHMQPPSIREETRSRFSPR